MQKIINGKLYDTNAGTPVPLGIWTSTYPRKDGAFFSERLCLSKNGVYFLYGRGNKASKYAKEYRGGRKIAGEDIIALTEEEAYTWAAEHLRPFLVEAIFPGKTVPA